MSLCDEVKKLSGESTSLVTIRDLISDTLNLVVMTGDKVAELKVDIKEIPKTNMIHLHQGISYFLYTDLIQATLQISKLTIGKKRVEELPQKEKVDNKAHQVQIKKILVDTLVVDNSRDKGTATQSLLKENEGTIKLLNKNLDIPTTRLIQTVELTEIEKDKEALNTHLINYKDRLLK